MRKLTRKPKRRASRTTRKKQPFFLRGLRLFVRIIKSPQVISLVVIGSLVGWVYGSGEYQAAMEKADRTYVRVFTKAGLTVQHILLEGQSHTPRDDILHAIKQTGSKEAGLDIGSPMTAVDLQKIKENLESLTWVRYASVERQYPSTLSVSIIERLPIALWQENGKVYLIDEDGEIIRTQHLKEYANLVLLVGEDAPSQATSLVAMLNTEPDLAKKVTSAIRVGKRRWDLRLGDIEVKLPEENAEKAWKNLAKMHRETHIADSAVEKIDLRVEEKIFVK